MFAWFGLNLSKGIGYLMHRAYFWVQTVSSIIIITIIHTVLIISMFVIHCGVQKIQSQFGQSFCRKLVIHWCVADVQLRIVAGILEGSDHLRWCFTDRQWCIYPIIFHHVPIFPTCLPRLSLMWFPIIFFGLFGPKSMFSDAQHLSES